MQEVQNKNYELFLKMKMEPYSGEWVIVYEGKIVAHGKNLKKAVGKAREKSGKKRLMIIKAPGKETMIY